MFAPVYYVLLWIFPILHHSGKCAGEVLLPYLTLYSPGEPDYTEVIVRRVGDNLTLVCELKGEALPHIYVWNFLPSDNVTDGYKAFKTEPRGPALGSRLMKLSLEPADSGHYVCSAPPYSTTKYILVQTKSGGCARGALWCGRCVLAPYVCDGYRDCVQGEDEASDLCLPHVCSRPDKLNCSSGRCISSAACCRSPGALCRQPSCCEEHPRYSRLEDWGEAEYPALFEDRHAPDEYGFIQSTIYTVTACALIFMIAVVLLVSAICKMHMKRAALRSYTQRPQRPQHPRAALSERQLHRFPPCYEASRLLEAERCGAGSPLHSSLPASPLRTPPVYTRECEEEAGGGRADGDSPPRAFGLARLSAIFSSRYRQVSTECPDVELRSVPPSTPRGPTSPLHYRSPTSCDLNTDFFLHPEISDCGRELNYMATPIDLFRRDLERPRALTLQLGRFQLSIPRLSRRRSLERRPDTPNVAELNIEDIDFVRLNSNETYTLNGRTIRLLGADFENYPMLNDSSVRPPPYTEAMRYKLFGPPPEYLSRDALNTERDENTDNTTGTEEQARGNVEMPPCYDELASGGDNANNNVITVIAITEEPNLNINNVTSNIESNTNVTESTDNRQSNNENNSTCNNVNNNITSNDDNANNVSFNEVINDLPAIDCDVNANGTDAC